MELREGPGRTRDTNESDSSLVCSAHEVSSFVFSWDVNERDEKKSNQKGPGMPLLSFVMLVIFRCFTFIRSVCNHGLSANDRGQELVVVVVVVVISFNQLDWLDLGFEDLGVDAGASGATAGMVAHALCGSTGLFPSC